jgi:hypothetical protein
VSTPESLRDSKRRISSALLDTPGISGVGLRGDRVVIYLERDDKTLEQHATTLAKQIAPDVSVLFEHSGPFTKHGDDGA